MHRQSETLYEDAMIAVIAKVHHLTVGHAQHGRLQPF